MAFEIPLDQIKQLQVLLRKEVNLSWYEPDKEDPYTLPKLPSIAETIAGLDPSPPNLRCKNCKGKLLRGLQSSICVFCGSNPLKDLPPDPIKFKDTAGYRYLLDSLHLDGSEMVGPIAVGNEPNRGRSAPTDEIPLSKLLDLEIRWPSELDGPPTSNTGEAECQSKGSLNLAAADLDRFFAQRKHASDAFEEQLASDNQIDSSANNTVQANENLSLFQNVQVPETATGSTEDQGGNSFSGWEANFQSASSGAVHEEFKSFDPSAVDLDEVFGPGKASLGGKKNGDLNPSESTENDWFQADIGRTSNSELTGLTGLPEVTINLNDVKTAEGANISSTRNLDWMQADQGQGSFNKKNDIATTDEAADPFDTWDDFTGSASTHDPSRNVSNSKITSQTGESEMIADSIDYWDDFTGSASTHDPSNTVSNLKITSQTGESKMIADSINAWDDSMGPAVTHDPVSSVSNSVITSHTGKSETNADLNDTKIAESTDGSSKTFDWMGDDLWQVSNNKINNNASTDELANTFDAWDGLINSAITQDPKQTVNQTSAAEQTSEIDMFSLSSNSHVMNFGGFKQHDLFSGQSSSPLSSAGANIQHFGASSSGRVANVDEIEGNSGDVSSAKLGTNDDAEMLLSQMHDLSFMLESNLSVPQK